MIGYSPIGLRWRTLVLSNDGLSRAQEAAIVRRLSRILDLWSDTPYMLGQAKPRVGTYCTAFVCAVLDELYHRPFVEPPADIPHDAAMHDRRTALGGMRWFLERYPNHVRVRDGSAQPGDLVITGPQVGGPGHAILVGPRENTLWQCSGPGVHFTGMSIPSSYRLFASYRMTDRETWS